MMLSDHEAALNRSTSPDCISTAYLPAERVLASLTEFDGPHGCALGMSEDVTL